MPENDSVSNDKGLVDPADSDDPLVAALLGSAGQSHPLFRAPSTIRRRMPTKQNSDIVSQVGRRWIEPPPTIIYSITAVLWVSEDDKNEIINLGCH